MELISHFYEKQFFSGVSVISKKLLPNVNFYLFF